MSDRRGGTLRGETLCVETPLGRSHGAESSRPDWNGPMKIDTFAGRLELQGMCLNAISWVPFGIGSWQHKWIEYTTRSASVLGDASVHVATLQFGAPLPSSAEMSFSKSYESPLFNSNDLVDYKLLMRDRDDNCSARPVPRPPHASTHLQRCSIFSGNSCLA